MRALQRICGVALPALLALAACAPAPQPQPRSQERQPARSASAADALPPSPPLVRAARSQIGATRLYDPAYVRLSYPGGDVPYARGVCTDVVIRALRTQGIDLQQRIHEDRIAHPQAYPARWRGLQADANIDHRRVPNQMAWFARQGWQREAGPRVADAHAGDFLAGDIVAWDLGGGVLHIGIVSDRKTRDGVPLILHNIGSGTQEENLLFGYRIIGHYRPALSSGAALAAR
ncbi:DUF1287 domain-containing protein [Luteimonas aquatica]|uniref:DUF1287 domain-containing protein n=1 Tax=Luteimonas aquatica TaxID=450364 RepID=UPI001F55B598|nr:DUF1287 domain-containing protein [Luteimonas aquatica]